MRTFPLKISSPDGSLYNGEIVKITLRGAGGDLAVMAGHIPFITSLQPCDVKLEMEDGQEKIGRVEGGVLTVSDKSTILLTGSLQWRE